MDNQTHVIKIEPMTTAHLNMVYEVECESFAVPWSKKSFRDEIEVNDYSIYFVCIVDEEIIGYIGMRHIINEGHITNLAIKEEFRHQGYGNKLLNKLIEVAIEKEMIGLTLEVRISNQNAQRLYTKNKFIPEGIRKNYYSDPQEDGIVMWKYFNKATLY